MLAPYTQHAACGGGGVGAALVTGGGGGAALSGIYRISHIPN